MSYLDKTFCASPHCENKCGRKLTDYQKQDSGMLCEAGDSSGLICYAYFCGEPTKEGIEDDRMQGM